MKKKPLETEKYEVVFGFRNPSTKHWLKVGDQVELTKPQAEPLLLGVKPRIKKLTKTVATKAAKAK
ncbi:MAG: hypothetical protein ACK5NC_11960 [Vibrio sp.]